MWGTEGFSEKNVMKDDVEIDDESFIRMSLN